MHSNPKLIKVIAGRTISATSQSADALVFVFDNGLTMKVKTATSNAKVATTNGKIHKVRQEDTDLSLNLEDGKSVTIQTAEATSSVMVRDKAGKMEYAD